MIAGLEYLALQALLVGILSFPMMQALPGDMAYRIAAGCYGFEMAKFRSGGCGSRRAWAGLLRNTSFWHLVWRLSAAAFLHLRHFGAPVIDEVRHQLSIVVVEIRRVESCKV